MKNMTLGLISGFNDGKIENCTCSGNITIPAASRDMFCAAGITGLNGQQGSIHDCTLSGRIKCGERVYGIAEQNHGSITQCRNKAVMEVLVESESGEVNGIAGGNTGAIEANTMEGSVHIELCKTPAKVKISKVANVYIYQKP